MRNIKLTIEYDGTNYCGWQVQLKDKTVHAEIIEALKKLTGKKPKIEYASRTDSGVHAYGQVASFRTGSRLPSENLKRGLNSYLPGDIAVVKVQQVGKKFNARYDTKAKLYKYIICDSDIRPAISNRYIYHHRLGHLDTKKMEYM